MKRTVHKIDVGDMTKKEVYQILDPSGRMWRQHKLETWFYIGISIVGLISFVLMVI